MSGDTLARSGPLTDEVGYKSVELLESRNSPVQQAEIILGSLVLRDGVEKNRPKTYSPSGVTKLKQPVLTFAIQGLPLPSAVSRSYFALIRNRTSGGYTCNPTS